MKRPFANTLATLALMTLALALFQRGGMLVPALAGVLLFGVLALLRPELGVLFVPLTAPLYLMPALVAAPLAGRAAPLRLPTYEVALLIVFGATAANWLWRRISTADDRPPTTNKHREPSQETKSKACPERSRREQRTKRPHTTDYGLRTIGRTRITHHASRITSGAMPPSSSSSSPASWVLSWLPSRAARCASFAG